MHKPPVLGWHVFGLPGAHELVAQGKTAEEIAEAINVSELTVKRWAQRSRIELQKAHPKRDRHRAVVTLAQTGKSIKEIAEATSYTYQAVSLILRKFGVKAVRQGCGLRVQDADRAEKMASMYRQGLCLETIGQHFGVTRERVRQILKKVGVTSQDGGKRKVTSLRREGAERRREAAAFARYGAGLAEVRECRKNGLLMAWKNQRNASAARGIAWRLTLGEWLTVWKESGKLAERGRGKGKYVMSRIRDEGGYEMGNVHIQLSTVNSSQGLAKCRNNKAKTPGVWNLYPGLSRPFVAKYGKHMIGHFATEHEATAARLAYEREHRNEIKLRGKGYSRIRYPNGSYRYQVLVGRKYIGVFKTPEDALTARAAALELKAA